MFFIFGTRMFGKCDKVGEQFYVATQFFHINFVPIVPVKSFVIMKGSESGGRFHGTQIGMSGRSVLYAYVRVAAIIGIIVGFGGMLCIVPAAASAGATSGLGSFFILVCVLIGSILTLVLSYVFNKASHARALDLADQLGIPHSMIDREFDAFGGDDRRYDREDIKDVIPADYDDRFLDDEGRGR